MLWQMSATIAARPPGRRRMKDVRGVDMLWRHLRVHVMWRQAVACAPHLTHKHIRLCIDGIGSREQASTRRGLNAAKGTWPCDVWTMLIRILLRSVSERVVSHVRWRTHTRTVMTAAVVHRRARLRRVLVSRSLKSMRLYPAWPACCQAACCRHPRRHPVCGRRCPLWRRRPQTNGIHSEPGRVCPLPPGACQPELESRLDGDLNLNVGPAP